jgi:hypothetical protein
MDHALNTDTPCIDLSIIAQGIAICALAGC